MGYYVRYFLKTCVLLCVSPIESFSAAAMNDKKNNRHSFLLFLEKKTWIIFFSLPIYMVLHNINNRTSQCEISFISTQGASKIFFFLFSFFLFYSWSNTLSGKRRTLTCSSGAGCSRNTWSDRLPWWPCACTVLHTPPCCWKKERKGGGVDFAR